MRQQLTLEQIEKYRSCVKRELAKRKWVYPKLIAKGKLTQEKADDEINTMEEIKAYFDYLSIYTAPQQMKLF